MICYFTSLIYVVFDLYVAFFVCLLSPPPTPLFCFQSTHAVFSLGHAAWRESVPSRSAVAVVVAVVVVVARVRLALEKVGC